LNESHRLILSDAPSLHVPLPRHPRVSRRARSGGMSRIALVSACRQADSDKTRVSSIYKRRVTPVPEEAAASTEASCCWARPSGLERGWMAPLEVWTRKVARFGLRDLALVLLAERLGHPRCTGGGCVSWLPPLRTWIAIPSPRRRGSVVRRPSKCPAEPIQAGRFPADQSRLRAFGRGDLPAHHRQEPRRCIHRTRKALTLPTSHKLLVLLLARRTTMLSPSTVSPLPCACAPIR